MISHLLDTDVCIYALKRRSAKLAEALKEHDGRIGISDITLFELHYGAALYEKPSTRIEVIESFAARVSVLPFESRAAMHAGQIRAALRLKGQTIGAYDVLIAGLARANGYSLVTNNVREFSRVEGLRLEKWI